MSSEHDSHEESRDDDSTVSPETYNAFIGQIQLDRVWLKSSRVTNRTAGDIPPAASVSVADERAWKDSDEGFQALHKYTADFRNEKNRQLAKIEVEFGLDYASAEPMTDELFATFASTNLPLNTWPYLREFLAGMVGRMGWLPFTLPALRFAGGHSSEDTGTEDLNPLEPDGDPNQDTDEAG